MIYLTLALQETYNNKLDLDKLYSETSNQFTPYNIKNVQSKNMNLPQQYALNSNANIPNQNISYYQNYNLNIADLTSNLKIGENYIPLDMNDYNKSKEKIQPAEIKNEKDHFDFVKEMFKKKK